MTRSFKQIGRGIKKFFGKTLPNGFNRFGKQVVGGLKELPQAFKDASKTYGQIENATQGIPIVSDLFGFSKNATNSIGHLLGGNVQKAIQPGVQAGLQATKLLA